MFDNDSDTAFTTKSDAKGTVYINRPKGRLYNVTDKAGNRTNGNVVYFTVNEKDNSARVNVSHGVHELEQMVELAKNAGKDVITFSSGIERSDSKVPSKQVAKLIAKRKIGFKAPVYRAHEFRVLK